MAEVLVAVWRLAEELVQENGIWLWSESKICGVGMKLKAGDMTIPFPPLFSFLSFTFFSHTQHFPVPFNRGGNESKLAQDVLPLYMS